MRAQLHQLQHQMQIALQADRAADCNHRIRPPKAQEIPRSFLLCRMCQQRIGPRDINHPVCSPPDIAVTAGMTDRLACPVAGMLVHTGQCVKNCRLADIGIARQRDCFGPVSFLLHQNIAAVAFADRDYRVMDQKAQRIAARTPTDAFHLRAFYQTQIQQPAPHAACCPERADCPLLTRGQLRQSYFLLHIKNPFACDFTYNSVISYSHAKGFVLIHFYFCFVMYGSPRLAKAPALTALWKGNSGSVPPLVHRRSAAASLPRRCCRPP